MDLIEALEQLSIHVKSREEPPKIGVISSKGCANHLERTPSSSHAIQSQEWRYSPLVSSINIDNGSSQQLIQFENSIGTLFSQIHDLNHDSKVIGHPSDHSKPRPPPTSLPLMLAGSLETSQEEDSDNSSQQSSSGYATSNSNSLNSNSMTTNSSNPLVVSLMKRNLQNITDTVRKLGTILNLGIQIESIYKSHLPKMIITHHSGGGSKGEPSLGDLLGNSISLCDSFLELFSSEPSFAHLQTIARYKEFCHLLMQRIHELESPSSSSAATMQYYLTTQRHHDDTSSEHAEMCLDDDVFYHSDDNNTTTSTSAQDALDCALLECDQSQLEFNSWTDNRLYVNNSAVPGAGPSLDTKAADIN